MVEQVYDLNSIFSSLGDPIRRDILHRVREAALSVGDIARHYSISFAGVAKHVTVLERAGLVRKTKSGKEQLVSINPAGLEAADAFLDAYRKLWEQRLDSLDAFLQTDKKGAG